VIDTDSMSNRLLVCEYWETGNVMGRFAKNVLPQTKYGKKWTS
jgi:hypothetical protein